MARVEHVQLQKGNPKARVKIVNSHFGTEGGSNYGAIQGPTFQVTIPTKPMTQQTVSISSKTSCHNNIENSL